MAFLFLSAQLTANIIRLFIIMIGRGGANIFRNHLSPSHHRLVFTMLNWQPAFCEKMQIYSIFCKSSVPTTGLFYNTVVKTVINHSSRFGFTHRTTLSSFRLTYLCLGTRLCLIFKPADHSNKNEETDSKKHTNDLNVFIQSKM